jgi:hypothetical protein
VDKRRRKRKWRVAWIRETRLESVEDVELTMNEEPTTRKSHDLWLPTGPLLRTSTSRISGQRRLLPTRPAFDNRVRATNKIEKR